MAKTGITVSDLKKFSSRIDTAMRMCLRQGYQPLYMPQLADVLMMTEEYAQVETSKGRGRKVPEYDRRLIVNYGSYVTSSAMVVGIEGDQVLTIFAHVPNYVSSPDNLERVIDSDAKKFRIPDEEFQRLQGLEDGRKVFVLKGGYGGSNSYSLANVDVMLNEFRDDVEPFFGSITRARRVIKSKRFRSELSSDDPPAHGYTALNGIGYFEKEDLSDGPIGTLLSLGFNGVGEHGISFSSLSALGMRKDTEYVSVIGKKP